MLWGRLGLRGKLFVSYVVCAVVAIAVLFTAFERVAPPIFKRQVMGPGLIERPVGGPGTFGNKKMLVQLCELAVAPVGGPAPGAAVKTQGALAASPPKAAAPATGAPSSGSVTPSAADRAICQSMQQSVRLAGLVNSLHRALLQTVAVSVVLALLASLGASLLVSRQIVGPVRRMLGATRRIAGGDYAERVRVARANARDEIGELAVGLNAMAASLEQTERRRLDLIGDVAHEMRTPLASLEGHLEGLLDEIVAPSPKTWAKMQAEAGRLRRLVNDLHELSRTEAGQVPLALANVPPGHIVEAALERLDAQFEEKGLDLRCALPSGLPPVRADRDRAVQVLTNLLTNALRYTPAPGRVDVAASAADGMVTLAVRDTGIGIAPEQMGHIFERFFRVEKSRSRAVGGSGVGLTIARALAEAMGGRLEAESQGLGRGSTFRFTLPAAP